jgi:hypothetical protein
MDVMVRRRIAAPADQVAAYAMDWRHDAEWTDIRKAELTCPAPGGGVGVGAQVTRTASFRGKPVHYVLEVVRHEPPTALEMRSVQAPFPMHVTYSFEAAGRSTDASIRVAGGPGGLARLLSPLMAIAVRRSLKRDLRRLAAKVEAR